MDSELKRASGHVKAGIMKRVKEIIHLMGSKETERENIVRQKMSELKDAFSNFEDVPRPANPR